MMVDSEEDDLISMSTSDHHQVKTCQSTESNSSSTPNSTIQPPNEQQHSNYHSPNSHNNNSPNSHNQVNDFGPPKISFSFNNDDNLTHVSYHVNNNNNSNTDTSQSNSDSESDEDGFEPPNFTIILRHSKMALNVHRRILARHSHFFEACFSCGMMEQLSGEMELELVLTTCSNNDNDNEEMYYADESGEIDEENGEIEENNCSFQEEDAILYESLFYWMIHGFYTHNDYSHVSMEHAAQLVSIMHQYQACHESIQALFRYMEHHLTWHHVISVFEIPQFLLEEGICGQKLLEHVNCLLKDDHVSNQVFTCNEHFNLSFELLGLMLQSFVTEHNYQAARVLIRNWIEYRLTSRHRFAPELYKITDAFTSLSSSIVNSQHKTREMATMIDFRTRHGYHPCLGMKSNS